MEPTELNNQEVQDEQFAQQPQEQVPDVAAQQEDASSPTDLAAAFAALRGNDKAAAQTPMATGEAQSTESGTNGGSQSAPVQPGESGISGTDAADLSGLDVNAYGQSLLNGIRQQVIQQKRDEWTQRGYRTFSVQDLARRNEDDGSYYYVNPDDGQQNWDRPGYRGFSRREAQEWCDSFNKELNEQWKKECSALEKEMMNSYAPTFRMLQFYDTYNKMSDAEKDIFNELSDAYAIVDRNGTIQGFNADLNLLARQAKSMASRFGTQAAQPTQQRGTQPQVRQPAVDARSSAGGTRQTSVPEFKDINDAVAYYEQQQRLNRKAGK